MQKFSLLALLLLVSSCGSVGQQIKVPCGPNDIPIRLAEKTQDTLSDQQVKDVLSFNEALVKKGCAVPNKG